jgi:hypothetical protein
MLLLLLMVLLLQVVLCTLCLQLSYQLLQVS